MFRPNPIIAKSPLFRDFDSREIELTLTNMAATTRTYKKSAPIYLEGDIVTAIGIIISGEVNVIKEDFLGNRSIISKLSSGDMFAEAYASAENKVIGVSVIADTECRVLMIDYEKIVNIHPNNTIIQTRLIKNMLNILADKNMLLTQKMEYLTKKTIRDKLMTYLYAVAKSAKSNKIIIPYNRQELADYLSVDRSALSREITRLQQEGLFSCDKNIFIISK